MGFFILSVGTPCFKSIWNGHCMHCQGAKRSLIPSLSQPEKLETFFNAVATLMSMNVQNLLLDTITEYTDVLCGGQVSRDGRLQTAATAGTVLPASPVRRPPHPLSTAAAAAIQRRGFRRCCGHVFGSSVQSALRGKYHQVVINVVIINVIVTIGIHAKTCTSTTHAVFNVRSHSIFFSRYAIFNIVNFLFKYLNSSRSSKMVPV